MIFYRSQDADVATGRISLRAARAMTAIGLAAYPIGGLVMLMDGAASRLAGFILCAVSLLAIVPLFGTHFQKIVAEQVNLLDEFELKLRQRAMSAAYACFTAIALIGVLYAALASDAGLWVPRTYEAFNALFWGIFLYATILPTAFLVWRRDTSQELADSGEESAE